MIDRYELNQNQLPTIIAPHDCVIEKVEIVDQEFLVFHFEKNINYHDSVKYIRPDANSLIMRFHLLDSDFEIYKWKKVFKKYAYILQDNNRIIKLWNDKEKSHLEYLYNYVAYNSLIIELYDGQAIMLQIETDYVEFEWLMEA